MRHSIHTLHASWLILLVCGHVFAASFEGFLGELPVWVDLELPSQDGAVSGSYFYKKVGAPIPLKGTQAGSKLDLQEFGRKNLVTGYFACTTRVDELVGMWGQKAGERKHEVLLFKAKPAWRKYAKNQAFRNLTLESGISLEEKIQSYSEEPYTEHQVYYTHNRKNVLSVAINWSGMGAYPNHGVDNYLIDLTTKGEIKFWDEIDPDALPKLSKKLAPKIETFMRNLRKTQPDSTWLGVIDFLGGKEGDKVEALDVIFSKGPPNRSLQEAFNGSYVTEGGVIFTDAGHGFLQLPHVVEDMDSKLEISMSTREFDAFIKPTSVLKNLAKLP